MTAPIFSLPVLSHRADIRNRVHVFQVSGMNQEKIITPVRIALSFLRLALSPISQFLSGLFAFNSDA